MDNTELLEEVKGVRIAIKRISDLNQEFEQYLHLQLIPDHNVHISALKLNGQALPRIIWEHILALFLVSFGRYDLINCLPLHPKPRRISPKNEARDIRELELPQLRLILHHFRRTHPLHILHVLYLQVLP